MGRSKAIYFSNLDGIRFSAALMVIVHHIEQLKNAFSIGSYWNNDIIRNLGKLGVILFFVLSGFLISYLLFKEEKEKSTINIKGFYIRRILRIWPLYFLIILLALFVLPSISILKIPQLEDLTTHTKLFKALPMYILFLPNLVLVVLGAIPFCSQTWSIGAEEQFYLIWPVLNKVIKNKLVIIFGVFFTYLIIRYFLDFHNESILYRFWDTMPIHFMSVGAFFAYISFFETKLTSFCRDIFYSRIAQISAISLIFIMLYFKMGIGYFNLELYSILFGLIILNAATGNKNIFYFNFSSIKFLGKISYGLYMYHVICIVFLIHILKLLNLSDNNLLLYLGSIIFTIIISTISFYTFEKFFLKHKNKFTTIKSEKNNLYII